jgi:hypothetical protein
LTATGEVAGAGTGGTATLTADVTATVGCINPGSKDQQPKGLQEAAATVTGSEEFTTKQGRGTFTVTTEPITIESFDFTCPGKMEETLVGDVTFSNIVLTITAQTGEISEPLTL